MTRRMALLSVWDKRGIVELASALDELGFELASTGGTAQRLREAGLSPRLVAEITGFPEILDGRVKTLHPAIMGGILARREKKHLAELRMHSLNAIDLVVVNLYPFEETIAKPETTLDEALEEIDIGGVTLLRAAAKNFPYVGVVVDPHDYGEIIAELRRESELTSETRKRLALKAFRHTAHYDAAISKYLASKEGLLPEKLHIELEKVESLRYGENPHQQAAFYRVLAERGLPDAVQLHGRKLSFNNILDLDAAWNAASDFDPPTAAVIKHTNPCGLASARTLAEAYLLARSSDPLAAYGSVVGLNRELDLKTARLIDETFVEAVIAPSLADDALDFLKEKRGRRLLQAPLEKKSLAQLDFRRVRGGLLAQERDLAELADELKTVTQRRPTEDEMKSLLFAWKVVKYVKSNAIVLAKGTQTVGVGAGQMKRVDAVRIALSIAGESAKAAVLASDAYIPFPDSVLEAAEAGVSAFIQPGGSVRDEEVIAAANEAGAAMVSTGTRHFRH